MDVFLNKLIDKATNIGMNLLYAIVVLIVGLKLVKIVVKLILKSHGFSKISESAQSFIKSFVSISLNTFVIISVLIILGVPTASFVTILASAGVAIGLALQGSLSNFAGGLMLVIFKPFKVGDYIMTDSYSGTVKEIAVFYTTLVTPDNKIITLPNGNLTNKAIINYSHESTRRLDLSFTVAYNSDIEQVKKILLDIAAAQKLALSEPEPTARLEKQNENSLVFYLRVWCNNDDYWALYYDLNEMIKNELDKNGIEIPPLKIGVFTDK